MRLRQVEYFVTINAYGSYTRAAAQMYVSQPSLSQQILALEKELGAPLFERVPSGVELTAAGAAFLPEARAVIAAVERSRTAVRNVIDGVGRELTVASIRSVASNILPGSIASWHARHPETLLNLRDYHHRTLLEESIRAGEGDVGIGPRPRNWEGSLHRIGYEEVVLVAQDPERIRDAVDSPQLLSDQDWVLFDPSHGLTEVSDQFFQAFDVEPRIAARLAQVEAALTLSLDGVGVTLIPQNVVPENLRAAHTLRAGPGLFRELVAYTGGQHSVLANRYIELLLELELGLVQKGSLPDGALIC